MKTIRITSGTYGYRGPDGRIDPKVAGDIIEVPDGEAERIIRRKVGVLVTAEAVATPPVGPEDDGQGMDTPSAEAPDKTPKTGHLDPKQLEKMNKAPLTELAVELGIDPDTLKDMTKAQLIEAITAVEVELPDGEDEDESKDETEDDGEEPPEGKLEDPVK